MSCLFVVATPIGNLEDITLRAIRVLGEVDLIACEDTRHTAHLLAAYNIRKPTISYFEHNEQRRSPELLDRMRAGSKIALVTDAGTPTISDPGYRLVNAALDAGFRVVAIPGASALIAALSIAGLPTDRFAFEGFLPVRATARAHLLQSLAGEPRTLIFYESPRRVQEALHEMAKQFGADRPAAILREITKTHEETIRGPLAKLAQRSQGDQLRGEIVIVVRGAKATEGNRAATVPTLAMLLDAGLGLKQASALVAKMTGRSRRDLYREALLVRAGRESVD
jgi:16S rRNA (cytidine1402-2'-O)-methyltransferase